MYILAYLDRYGYPVLILIAGALADFYRGRITMLFVLAVGILLDGIYNLVGYLCRWRHIYLCYQSMCHTKMTPSRIEWDRMTKKDAYGIPATFIIGGIIGILVSIFLRSSAYNYAIMVTIQSHAKLRSANACIQSDKQFYMAK